MKILIRFFLIIFSLFFFACKQDTAKQNQTKYAPPLPDSILLHQADSFYDLAETITDLKKSDSALSLHQRALAIREKLLTNDLRLVNSYYKVGMLYSRDNKYDVADKYLEAARRIAEFTNAPTDILCNIYLNLVTCKKEMQDYPTAISIVQRLLRLLEHSPSDTSMLADANSRMASILLAQSSPDKAIELWIKAARLAPESDHQLLGRVNYGISVSQAVLKQFRQSLIFINRSIHEDLAWAGPESEPVADRYLWKAFVLIDLNKLDSVPYFLRQTLQIRKKIFGEKHSYIYGVNLGLGDFYYRAHEYDSAAHYHQESIRSLLRKFNNSDFFVNPKPEKNELNSDLIQILVKKAKVAMRLFERDSSKTELLDLALNTYLLADSVFAGYRRNILHDDPVLQQMESHIIPFQEMLLIASELFKRKKSAEYFEKTFHVMESSRAIVLQSALNRAVALGSAGISDSLLKKENGFIRRRAELLQRMNYPGLRRSAVDSLNEELLVNNNAEVDLREELKKINPNYFSIRYDTTPSIDDLKRLLIQRKSIFLEYMWSDSMIYTLLISPDTIKMKSIPVTREFSMVFGGFINEFRKDPEGTIGLERFQKFCNNSFSLYRYLIKGLLDGIPEDAHLVISADGPLAATPFEALITRIPEMSEVNYHLPYLVLEHPVSYAYSAGVLINQSVHLRKGKKLLAFGYAGHGERTALRSGMSNLPGTEKEVLAIKDIMKNHVNQYKLQGEASESFFKHHVSNFDIVHLAIHGEVDTLNALNSRLIFRHENDSTEDGSLYAHELYDLNLSKLDLAVLSACESGLGKRQIGEGLMSIARGFAYAGCPSLVISLWKIDDRTSAQVMRGFYSHLSQGEPLDISIARAKTDYIMSAGEFTSHPFYWAAFLQVGNVDKLDMQKPNWWGWVFGGLGGCLLIYSLIKLTKR